MAQSALRDVQHHDSLAERLAAQMAHTPQEAQAPNPIETKPEPTVSIMAARFAPEMLRATREAASQRLARNDAALSALGAEARRGGFPSRNVVGVLTVVAIAPAMVLAGLLWLGAIRAPEVGIEVAPPGPASSQQAAVATTALLSPARPAPEIALTAPQQIAGGAGEEVGFAITIDSAGALPPRSVIAIRGLPEGATFSQGRPYGDSEWSLRPDEIAGLALRLPEGGSGASDLRVELVGADGTALAGAATRLDIMAHPAAGLVVRAGEADRVEDLMAHGNKMISVGYFAGARAYFSRAAEAGSGEAALAVGATYDPAFIAALDIQGIKPEPGTAARWYERAAALGVTDRDTKLAALEQDWAAGASPKSSPHAAAPAEAAAAPATAPEETVGEADKPGALGRLVAAAAELTRKDQWVEVSDAVNMREGASGTAKTLKVVAKGTKLQVKNREGNWIQVANPETSEEGWIYMRFLKETAAP